MDLWKLPKAQSVDPWMRSPPPPLRAWAGSPDSALSSLSSLIAVAPRFRVLQFTLLRTHRTERLETPSLTMLTTSNTNARLRSRDDERYRWMVACSDGWNDGAEGR